MSTVTLPDTLKHFVDEQAASTGSTPDAYVQALVTREQERHRLRAALEAGADSPLTSVADAAYFQSLRQRIG